MMVQDPIKNHIPPEEILRELQDLQEPSQKKIINEYQRQK